MNSTVLKVFCAVSSALFLATLFFLSVQIKEKNQTKEEIKQLKAEKMIFLSEHAECLRHKETVLKKELFEKYIDSMIQLVNKIESGTKPSETELLNFNDRMEFVVENIEHLEFSKNETAQYLIFLSSAKKSVEQFTTGGKEEN